ncbi:MAG: hypothetical protein M3R67_13630, partial [Acidobacteriota bacterium]|nr:hypothetical protein [Acidobacteriota bacterium]
IRAGDFDVVRRGIVMQTTDELTNIRMLFQEGFHSTAPVTTAGEEPTSKSTPEASSNKLSTVKAKPLGVLPSIETESQALKDLSAMPIYFASSYALVKPYVEGFDSNVLDAPSLKTVRINPGWKPPETSNSPVTIR